MNSRMNHLFRALITLAVILMFAAALISAQAHANLEAKSLASGGFAATTGVSIVLDEESLRTLESLPHVIDAVLALPIVVDLGADDLPTDGASRHDSGIIDSQGQ